MSEKEVNVDLFLRLKAVSPRHQFVVLVHHHRRESVLDGATGGRTVAQVLVGSRTSDFDLCSIGTK